MEKEIEKSASNKNKTILITGAGGFLGGELIQQLSQNSNYKIIALTSQKKKLLSRFSHVDQLECFSIEEWKNGNIPWKQVDTLIHCAFAIVSDGEKLGDSLNFTREIFEDAQKWEVASIVNISSRSVYGNKYKPLWKETTPVAPETLYGMAKYSSELLLKAIATKNGITKFTNIRLSSLIGEGFDIRVVSKFVNKALEGQPIKIIGGKQIFSYLDIRDAASGIISLLSVNPNKWKEVYNLGSNKRYSIIEIANIVLEVGKNFIKEPVKIEIEDRGIVLDIGMDSSLFYKDTGWAPKYNIRDTVTRLFEYHKKSD